ncbi:MAG: hypothetical protein MZV70_74935 [Desulfobacterales bacterium]|nr:hypothetical protein [Desulfobacterales bacterium]
MLISWYLVCGGGNAQIGCCGVAGNIGGVASKGVGLRICRRSASHAGYGPPLRWTQCLDALLGRHAR